MLIFSIIMLLIILLLLIIAFVYVTIKRKSLNPEAEIENPNLSSENLGKNKQSKKMGNGIQWGEFSVTGLPIVVIIGGILYLLHHTISLHTNTLDKEKKITKNHIIFDKYLQLDNELNKSFGIDVTKFLGTFTNNELPGDWLSDRMIVKNTDGIVIGFVKIPDSLLTLERRKNLLSGTLTKARFKNMNLSSLYSQLASNVKENKNTVGNRNKKTKILADIKYINFIFKGLLEKEMLYGEKIQKYDILTHVNFYDAGVEYLYEQSETEDLLVNIKNGLDYSEQCLHLMDGIDSVNIVKPLGYRTTLRNWITGDGKYERVLLLRIQFIILRNVLDKKLTEIEVQEYESLVKKLNKIDATYLEKHDMKGNIHVVLHDQLLEDFKLQKLK